MISKLRSLASGAKALYRLLKVGIYYSILELEFLLDSSCHVILEYRVDHLVEHTHSSLRLPVLQLLSQ